MKLHKEIRGPMAKKSDYVMCAIDMNNEDTKSYESYTIGGGAFRQQPVYVSIIYSLHNMGLFKQTQ